VLDFEFGRPGAVADFFLALMPSLSRPGGLIGRRLGSTFVLCGFLMPLTVRKDDRGLMSINAA